MSIAATEKSRVTPQPDAALNFHQRNPSSMTLKVEDKDDVEEVLSKLEESKD